MVEKHFVFNNPFFVRYTYIVWIWYAGFFPFVPFHSLVQLKELTANQGEYIRCFGSRILPASTMLADILKAGVGMGSHGQAN